MASIAQWNCRGLRNNFEELVKLIEDNKTIAACLQETFLKADNNYSVKGFKSYNKIGGTGERAAGGSSILIKESIPQKEIPLNTNLQAVAVNISLHKSLTLCSIYLPPSQNVTKEELDNIMAQLPQPVLLSGDFNCGATHILMKRATQLNTFLLIKTYASLTIMP